ncbi:MAG: fold-containing protein [Marmoricola sp.]|nr:fold-containing protein [Marmoricola sp.]
MQVVQVGTLGLEPSARRRALGLLVLGTVAFVLAGLLGRTTVVDGRALSLVWPASGVATLMTGACPRRDRPLALVLVGAAAYVLNVLTGVGASLSLVFVISNVAQALVGGELLRRTASGLLVRPTEAAGDAGHARVRDVGGVLLSSVVGGLVGALLGALAVRLVAGTWSWADTVVWWGRNSAGAAVVLLTVLLLVSGSRATGERSGASGRTARSAAALQGRLTRLAEPAGLLVVTAVLYLVVFVLFPAVPLAFPLLLPTVWVGLRFSPPAVALHGAAVSVFVTVLTVTRRGPFVDGRSWHQEALVSQSFVVLVVGLGLVLALGRAELTTLSQTLARAQVRSESQALMLSAVIDSMRDGLTVVDREGRVLVRNEAGARIAGAASVSDTSVAGYTMHGTDGNPLEPHELPQTRVFETEGSFAQEVALRYKDRSPTRTLSISGRRLPAADPAADEQAVLVYHDVTADRRQRTLLESYAGVVAHDLRGPLSVIDGWTDLLALDLGDPDEPDGPEAVPTVVVRPKVERIQRAVVSMQHLIEDLLDASTTRDEALRERVVDLTAVARDVADQRGAVATGVAPRIRVEPMPPAYADPGLVRQLLDNLVSNAVKYVIPGEVPEVTVSARSVGRWVEVSVTDRGIGIPLAHREEVFEAFHRAPTQAAYDGHGIGLAVCRRIVERHGGTIAVTDPPDGAGTRFVLSLPAAQASPGADRS